MYYNVATLHYVTFFLTPTVYSYIAIIIFISPCTSIATEIRFQPPPTCPGNYVPRAELMKEISSAVLNSDITPTIGTTVTIRGIGGIGKSTIAKALCHDPLIKEHFVNGFLWISLTPPLPNPMTKLSEIYQRLTGKCATTNISILQNEIRLLVSSNSCKLLVILDDVWEAENAMMFVDVFSSCKVVLTTRKMDINTLIPPRVCINIESMSPDEAVELLTLQILKVETLCVTDINRITELAKDLHYWPLLLSLVHGQLYFHCVEWNESPNRAILKVQNKLFDNGLTAFDPDNHANRENAVRASITASLQLLSKEEEKILRYIASSLIGIGMLTFNDLLCTVLHMESTQFNNYTKNLWCHGLIKFEEIRIYNPVTTHEIPCIGIHEVIGEFINENIPDEFYLNINMIENLEVFNKMLHDNYFDSYSASNRGASYLSKADVFYIPYLIRFSMVFAKHIQVSYFSMLNELCEQSIHLLNNNNFKDFIEKRQLPVVKHIHRMIKQDCNSIHTLLVDNKYSETLKWTKQYFDKHPWKVTLELIISHFENLIDLCQKNFNHKETVTLKGHIDYYYRGYSLCKDWKRFTLRFIITCFHILCLVNSSASDDDITYYLKCSNITMWLYTANHKC